MSSVADFIRAHSSHGIPDGKPVEDWEMRCNYLDCAWGMGLAGMGRCRHGNPRDPKCSGFELDVDYEEEPAPSPETEGKEQL